MTTEKRREDRARRTADRLGLAVRKDRAQTWSLNRQGGYRLVNPDLNIVVAGEQFDLTLDDLETFLGNTGST
jgi:hypothetical protein